MFGPLGLNEQMLAASQGWTFQPPPPPPPPRNHPKRQPAQPQGLAPHSLGSSAQGTSTGTPSSAAGSQADRHEASMSLHGAPSRRASSVDNCSESLIHSQRPTNDSLQSSMFNQAPLEVDPCHGAQLTQVLQRLESKLMSEVMRVQADSQAGYHALQADFSKMRNDAWKSINELKEQNRLLRNNNHALEAQNGQLHRHILMLQDQHPLYESHGMEAARSGPTELIERLWDGAAAALGNITPAARAESAGPLSTKTSSVLNVPATAGPAAAPLTAGSCGSTAMDRLVVPRVPHAHTHGNIW